MDQEETNENIQVHFSESEDEEILNGKLDEVEILANINRI